MVRNNNSSADSSDAAATIKPPTVKRWPVGLAACICIYYTISTTTLPLANYVWLGESPSLAVIQLPKAVVKSVTHAY